MGAYRFVRQLQIHGSCPFHADGHPKSLVGRHRHAVLVREVGYMRRSEERRPGVEGVGESQDLPISIGQKRGRMSKDPQRACEPRAPAASFRASASFAMAHSFGDEKLDALQMGVSEKRTLIWYPKWYNFGCSPNAYHDGYTNV